jgi:hypothetical protein
MYETKERNIGRQNYRVACGFVWPWNVVFKRENYVWRSWWTGCWGEGYVNLTWLCSWCHECVHEMAFAYFIYYITESDKILYCVSTKNVDNIIWLRRLSAFIPALQIIFISADSAHDDTNQHMTWNHNTRWNLLAVTWSTAASREYLKKRDRIKFLTPRKQNYVNYMHLFLFYFIYLGFLKTGTKITVE